MTRKQLHHLEQIALESLHDLTEGTPTLTPYGRALMRQQQRKETWRKIIELDR